MRTHEAYAGPDVGERRDPKGSAAPPSTAAREFERKIGITASELRALVEDISRPRAGIYWGDMLASCAAAYGAFALAVVLPVPAPAEAGLLAIGAAAAYRATLFTHELVHLPRKGFVVFRIAWNVLCGIPLLVPSFLYEVHAVHHERRSYGTAADGEYRAFASAPLGEAVASVAVAPLAVPALVVRFLLLAPLGWLVPPLRRVVLSRVSALVIDFGAVRELPRRLPVHWFAQEAACFLYCATLVGLFASGQVSAGALLRAYLVVTLAILANALRVLGAHRYRSSGAPMSFADQILDSNNFPGGLAALWAPLGLRFHAVHHLLPSLPYHSLGEAYRRVMRAVPSDSGFRQTRRESFVAAIRDSLGGRPAAMRARHEG